jgi:ActR/RegA family two-component response regulator
MMLTKAPVAQAASKPHVLICDDDTAFSAELIEALEMRGYTAAAL